MATAIVASLIAVAPGAAASRFDAAITTDPPLPAYAYSLSVAPFTNDRIKVYVEFGQTFERIEEVCVSATFEGDLLDMGEIFEVMVPAAGQGIGVAHQETRSGTTVCWLETPLSRSHAALIDGEEWLEVGTGREGVKLGPEASFRLVSLTVSLTGVPDDACTISGTAGPDRLIGTEGRDVICGLAGDDVIVGKGGDDDLMGGPGRDIIYGGSGADNLLGEGQRDILVGGSGADLIRGGEGPDRMYGGRGDDLLNAGNGNDFAAGDAGDDVVWLQGGVAQVADGGTGNDRLTGGSGPDRLYGRNGDDYLYSNPGDDQLFGGRGDDWLIGHSGQNRMYGGPGQDQLSSDYGQRYSDYLCGQAGRDTYRFTGPEDSVCHRDLLQVTQG